MKLSARERQALTAFRDTSPDFGFLSFASIATRSGLDRSIVRRTVRALARKGLAIYAKGLWNDDGECRGAGYGLTPAGRAELDTTIAAGEDVLRQLAEVNRS